MFWVFEMGFYLNVIFFGDPTIQLLLLLVRACPCVLQNTYQPEKDNLLENELF